MEYRNAKVTAIKTLGIEESSIKTISSEDRTFEVEAPTGVYKIKPTQHIGMYHVTSNDVTYSLSIRQTKITLHAESRCSLEQFAQEFGVEMDPEAAKGIWIIPDAVFSDLGDDVSDFKEIGIAAYLNAAEDSKDVLQHINRIDRFIDNKLSLRNGQLLFSDHLSELAQMATFVADNEEYLANDAVEKLKDEIFVFDDVFNGALKTYVGRLAEDLSVEKIVNCTNTINDFKLEVIFSAFNYGVTATTSGPMDFDIYDYIVGFGLVTSDHETSFYDLVQMMFYDTNVHDYVMRSIRVPLRLLVEKFREHETEAMNATEYVIRQMSRSLMPYEYYKVGIDWFETYDYNKDRASRSLTDAIYIFRDGDVTVDSLIKDIGEMKPSPVSDELKHLLTVIQEDCCYDFDGCDEDDDEEE